jgi:pyruvate carboxylase subunit B
MINGKYHKVKFNGKGSEIGEAIAGAVKEEINANVKAIPINAPMPGRIWKILKKVGDEIKEDEVVLVLEAMKMENDIKSTVNGKIVEILVSEGDHVPGEAVLVKVAE